MKRTLTTTCLVLLILFASQVQALEPEEEETPAVTLTLARVRGVEYFSMPLEGPLKGQKVREALLACDVVIDNRTGGDLTVLSNFFSAFDGLGIVLLKEGKVLREQSYLYHQSPMYEKRPYVLKRGKNKGQMRFPIFAAPQDWADLEVKIVGGLPGSRFTGTLSSETKEIQRVAEFERIELPAVGPDSSEESSPPAR